MQRRVLPQNALNIMLSLYRLSNRAEALHLSWRAGRSDKHVIYSTWKYGTYFTLSLELCQPVFLPMLVCVCVHAISVYTVLHELRTTYITVPYQDESLYRTIGVVNRSMY